MIIRRLAALCPVEFRINQNYQQASEVLGVEPNIGDKLVSPQVRQC